MTVQTYPCHTCGYMVDVVRQWCPKCLAFRLIDQQPEITDEGSDANIDMIPRLHPKGAGEVLYDKNGNTVVTMHSQPERLTVWWCTLCRETVQIGAKPEICSDCGSKDIDSFQAPWVKP